MGIEVERKWLISSFPESESLTTENIEQVYLSLTDSIEIRIRKKTTNKVTKSILTIKSLGAMIRREFEYNIPIIDYEELKQFCSIRAISKKRYYFKNSLFGSNINEVVIDRYLNHLSGLIIAEVEFLTIEDANKFNSPEWFDKEVTKDLRYKNVNLAIHGIPH